MWECVAIREDRSEDEAAGVTFMTLCMKEVEAGQRRGRVGEGRRLEEKTGEVRPPRQSTAVLWRNPALTGIVGGQLTDLR